MSQLPDNPHNLAPTELLAYMVQRGVMAWVEFEPHHGLTLMRAVLQLPRWPEPFAITPWEALRDDLYDSALVQIYSRLWQVERLTLRRMENPYVPTP